VVQVHPGPPFKSPINTRRFSLFPFSGPSLKKKLLFRKLAIHSKSRQSHPHRDCTRKFGRSPEACHEFRQKKSDQLGMTMRFRSGRHEPINTSCRFIFNSPSTTKSSAGFDALCLSKAKQNISPCRPESLFHPLRNAVAHHESVKFLSRILCHLMCPLVQRRLKDSQSGPRFRTSIRPGP